VAGLDVATATATSSG